MTNAGSARLTVLNIDIVSIPVVLIIIIVLKEASCTVDLPQDNFTEKPGFFHLKPGWIKV